MLHAIRYMLYALCYLLHAVCYMPYATWWVFGQACWVNDPSPVIVASWAQNQSSSARSLSRLSLSSAHEGSCMLICCCVWVCLLPLSWAFFVDCFGQTGSRSRQRHYRVNALTLNCRVTVSRDSNPCLPMLKECWKIA